MLLVLPLALAASAMAAPAGWKTLHSDDGQCELQVPGSWSSSFMGGLELPGSRSHVFIYRQEEPLPERKALIVRTGQVISTLEDSTSRYWVELHDTGGMHAWNVVVPAPGGDCYAEITFDEKLSAADAKNIAMSVHAQTGT
jgi:hypothetical protein